MRRSEAARSAVSGKSLARPSVVALVSRGEAALSWMRPASLVTTGRGRVGKVGGDYRMGRPIVPEPGRSGLLYDRCRSPLPEGRDLLPEQWWFGHGRPWALWSSRPGYRISRRASRPQLGRSVEAESDSAPGSSVARLRVTRVTPASWRRRPLR